MKIFLHELTDHDTELDFTQEVPWVADAVKRADEPLHDSPVVDLKSKSAPVPPPRPVRIHFSLRKVDDVVVVTGSINTYIELVCSRCANIYQQACKPGFSGLFCKDPVMAGVAHLEAGKAVDRNHGFARHAHDTANDELQAEGKDLDITYLAHDFIDLSDVLSEHLQLQVPFQPLCQESCKGICTQCGADLNTGRCACAKIATTRPFSVLKDLQMKA